MVLGGAEAPALRPALAQRAQHLAKQVFVYKINGFPLVSLCFPLVFFVFFLAEYLFKRISLTLSAEARTRDRTSMAAGVARRGARASSKAAVQTDSVDS